jgi:hypothetical protein
MVMIISASRRTDIPAFYSLWFEHRIKAGFCQVRNPFNASQLRHVSLEPQEVDAFVFWTRNAHKFIPTVNSLIQSGYQAFFLYTLTGYGPPLEKFLAPTETLIETFCRLSGLIGSERIAWRYDPILIADESPFTWRDHARRFRQLAQNLEGATHRVIISFTDWYAKTQQHLGAFPWSWHLEPDKQTAEKFLQWIIECAESHGMTIHLCAKPGFETVQRGKCIDAEWINQATGKSIRIKRDKGQRPSCLCDESIDIGCYNTCGHGCQYCYATRSHSRARYYRRQHDPEQSFL